MPRAPDPTRPTFTRRRARARDAGHSGSKAWLCQPAWTGRWSTPSRYRLEVKAAAAGRFGAAYAAGRSIARNTTSRSSRFAAKALTGPATPPGCARPTSARALFAGSETGYRRVIRLIGPQCRCFVTAHTSVSLRHSSPVRSGALSRVQGHGPVTSCRAPGARVRRLASAPPRQPSGGGWPVSLRERISRGAQGLTGHRVGAPLPGGLIGHRATPLSSSATSISSTPHSGQAAWPGRRSQGALRGSASAGGSSAGHGSAVEGNHDRPRVRWAGKATFEACRDGGDRPVHSTGGLMKITLSMPRTSPG